ncbi:hypothetical protein DO97_13310 [Neosynechococcus sphagnicola sy1]|uniref:Uncharacterized protein n=1 Tax=Neosynechococcus sphagnicola sy1 TaxID=1497020 RepID=A0A098TMD9_9CYAN|nr:hypothetical protein DO97_13310 [Neosynechococcus sphagnicola sy1]
MFYVLQTPLAAAEYFLALLGSPFAKAAPQAALLGVVPLVMWGSFALLSWQQRASRFRIQAAPWLSLGLFPLLFALLVTVGRAGFGLDQATSSRYTTPAMLLVVAVIQLWRLWLMEFPHTQRQYRLWTRVATLLAALLIYSWVLGSGEALTDGRRVALERATGKACLEVLPLLVSNSNTDRCLQTLYPAPGVVRQRMETLQQLGWRSFLTAMAWSPHPTQTYGYIDQPATTSQPMLIRPPHPLTLAGWAILPNSDQQPVVFFTQNAQKVFFAVARGGMDSPDVAKALGSARYGRSRWEAEILTGTLPLAPTVINAWVYDSNQQKFVKLKGEPQIKVVEES